MGANWQSISTAPRDGTHIWAFIPVKFVPKQGGKRTQFHHRCQLEIWWCPGPVGGPLHTPSKHALELAKKHDGYWTATPSGFKPIHGSPSHWMPLPQPPQEEKE